MSSKSPAQKLGIKPGQSIFVDLPPKSPSELLGALPAGASIVEKGAGPFPLILLFVKDRATMTKALPQCKSKLATGGIFWLAYAKGTSRLAADINRDSIREYAAAIGLHTVSLIAIDDDWSALRLKPR